MTIQASDVKSNINAALSSVFHTFKVLLTPKSLLKIQPRTRWSDFSEEEQRSLLAKYNDRYQGFGPTLNGVPVLREDV